ncbi:hypothetical protein EDD85DRAFT_1028945 [Armillaria nabsnona]|nr:hypothetical protein EDD85DRAFT_1028945 [Armillaria nabsnona]
MTEYDYSPEAAERYQATMRRISRWVDDAEAHACEYKSPFVPRSDVGDDDVPPQPVLSRGISHRVPPPLYAPVPGPMPPHSHGPAPPPPRPQPVPLHGPAPPPSHSRHTHSPTRRSSTRHSSSHQSHSKHRSGSTFYISPTPTPPPVPYYPGYNNPYYQARPSPYAPPPPQPQYYRSGGNVAYAPPQGGYVVIPQKGRSSKVISSVQPVVFSTSSSTDSEPLPQRQPQSGSFLQKVFPFTHGRRDSPAPAAYDHQREHRPHHHHHHHHHRHSS